MVRQQSREDLEKQIKELRHKLIEREKELDATRMDMELGISEVVEALEQIGAGDPDELPDSHEC